MDTQTPAPQPHEQHVPHGPLADLIERAERLRQAVDELRTPPAPADGSSRT